MAASMTPTTKEQRDKAEAKLINAFKKEYGDVKFNISWTSNNFVEIKGV